MDDFNRSFQIRPGSIYSFCLICISQTPESTPTPLLRPLSNSLLPFPPHLCVTQRSLITLPLHETCPPSLPPPHHLGPTEDPTSPNRPPRPPPLQTRFLSTHNAIILVLGTNCALFFWPQPLKNSWFCGLLKAHLEVLSKFVPYTHLIINNPDWAHCHLRLFTSHCIYFQSPGVHTSELSTPLISPVFLK